MCSKHGFMWLCVRPTVFNFNTKLAIKGCRKRIFFFVHNTHTIWTCTESERGHSRWWRCLVLLPQSEVLAAAACALVPSPLTSPLHAEVLGHCLSALLTLHRAAPVEFAIAARHHLGFPLLHGQAALPAEPLAAPLLPLAQALALLEALAALCAREAQGAVLQAVIWGVLQVDQLLAGDGAEGLGHGPSAGRAVPGSTEEVHLQRPVVLLLQVVAHLPELRQLQPAGLSGAASRHTVALTRPLHGPLDSLKGEKQRECLLKNIVSCSLYVCIYEDSL